MLLNGKYITGAPVRDRCLAGLSYIPEDRQETGAIPDMTLQENLALREYYKPPFSQKGILRGEAFRSDAKKLIKAYDIRCAKGPDTVLRSMSGGNQQKAIVGRELDHEHSLLIAIQPTRGLDVGAIESIHSAIVAKRDAGAAVLLISLELDEVMSLSDRILVMYEGEIVGELDPKKTTVEEMGLYMAGAKRQ